MWEGGSSPPGEGRGKAHPIIGLERLSPQPKGHGASGQPGTNEGWLEGPIAVPTLLTDPSKGWQNSSRRAF